MIVSCFSSLLLLSVCESLSFTLSVRYKCRLFVTTFENMKFSGGWLVGYAGDEASEVRQVQADGIG